MDLIDLMPITPNWTDIALRLAATVIAGAFIGLDRERGGHAAGLRTTILVGLAACGQSTTSTETTTEATMTDTSMAPPPADTSTATTTDTGTSTSTSTSTSTTSP